MSRAYKAQAPIPEDSGDSESDDHPLQPFPSECLPGAAGDMARAIVQAACVPVSLSGSCVLGILSASIIPALQVQSRADRVTRGNLYILASAESATGKSEAFRHAAQPLLQFEDERIQQWKANTFPALLAEKAELEEELRMARQDIRKTDSGMERENIRHRLQTTQTRLVEIEDELLPPGLIAQNCTVEKLAVHMHVNRDCSAILSADAGEVLNIILGKYNKLDRTDDNLYVQAYTGEYIRVDRMGRPSVVMQKPCLSSLLLTQPDKLDTLLSERSLTDGGYLPRNLICHTNCQPSYVNRDPQGIPHAILSAWNNLIRNLLQTYRLGAETHTIEPDQAAMRLLHDHHDAIVDRRKSDLKDITSYAGRWNEQAWRLSVNLHAALHGAHAHECTLSADTALRAINLAEWFAAQQLDILSGGRWKAKREQRNEVLSLLAEKPDGITARDVQRAGIARTADEARELLAELQQGILEGRDVTPERGGHTVRIYTRKVGR